MEYPTNRIPQKSICIPAARPVDVSDLQAVLNHPCFQRLRYRKQLGINHLVFPGAVHTRFEHSIGVLGLTRHVCDVRRIQGAKARLLCLYAVLHDIGHGPFSHQIEPILDGDHHERGRVLIETRLAAAVQASGVHPEDIGEFIADPTTPRRLVDDRNLGTDKLDYLQRDALHIGFTGVPDIERILQYTVFTEGQPAIEEKFVEEVKRLQKFYSYLHQHGYLNKTALAVQRVLQRAVQEELSAGDMDPGALWDMTDAELRRSLQDGVSPRGRRLVQLLDTRDFHRSAVVVKASGYGYMERTTGKSIKVLEWPVERIQAFTRRVDDCGTLRALEDRLAGSLGVEPGAILLAAMPFFVKLVPRDVQVYSAAGSGNYRLFGKDPSHLASLEADYLRTFAIRVIVLPHLRRKVMDQTETVETVLAEAARSSVAPC